MKLLTLNTHSLVEAHYPEKLVAFVQTIAQEKPDILALQEVNQSIAATPLSALPTGYTHCGANITIRQDNHAYQTAKLLEQQGIGYFWTWLPLKLGYQRYDEGIGIFSRSPILETKVIPVSAIDDYHNWKTRKLLGIRTAAAPDTWFLSVHYGWWDDPEEPFSAQWCRTVKAMESLGQVWLLGDFNSPAEVRGEGYDQIAQSGWHDSFTLAKCRDDGITVGHVIDGWREKTTNPNGMRIDQIWCKLPETVTSSCVIFNGTNAPVVSDHYGIVLVYERGEAQ